MILQSFPDLQWLKHQAEKNFDSQRNSGGKLSVKGWPSVILNVSTRHTYRDNIRGPLSIFTNVKGESTVFVDGKARKIKEGFFFITNPHQYYTLHINAETDSETFNIHFGEHFLEQSWQALTLAHDDLLDNEFNMPLDTLAFHNRLNRRSDALNNVLAELRLQRDSSALHFDQHLFELANIILEEELNLQKITLKLPPIRKSTKDEVMKRLTSSVDFIYENFDRDVTLDEIARASCLSKFHFLRLFKTAFLRTPGDFMDEVRMEKAKALLKNSKMEVAEVSRHVGYRNPSSFSRMFRRHNGIYPTQFRVT